MQSSVRMHPICIEGNRQLSLRWIWIISIAIPVAELTLTIVDKHFRLLINSNLSCAGYCFTLSVESLGNTSISSASYTPSSVIRDHMLILSHGINVYGLRGNSEHIRQHQHHNNALLLLALLHLKRTIQGIGDSILKASTDILLCGLRGCILNHSVDLYLHNILA